MRGGAIGAIIGRTSAVICKCGLHSTPKPQMAVYRGTYLLLRSKLLVEGSPPLLCITQRLFMRSLCGMKLAVHILDGEEPNPEPTIRSLLKISDATLTNQKRGLTHWFCHANNGADHNYYYCVCVLC